MVENEVSVRTPTVLDGCSTSTARGGWSGPPEVAPGRRKGATGGPNIQMAIVAKPFPSPTIFPVQLPVRAGSLFDMVHTRKSKAWASWLSQAWKSLNRVAMPADEWKNNC
jgi:hypothetical protein